MQQITIRTIQHPDDPFLGSIVRNTLAEFGANHPGTVYYDETTDNLFSLFQKPRSIYFVAEFSGKICGGAGIYPSNGLPPDTCELVKMYLIPELRGKGIGKLLIEKCLEFAYDSGYAKVYLETMPELKKAMTIYENFGFRYIAGPLGNTGHFGCSVFMIKQLF